MVSARERDAVSCRQRYVRTNSRNLVRAGTLSQCSSWSNEDVCSDFLTEKTSLAAAVSTDMDTAH